MAHPHQPPARRPVNPIERDALEFGRLLETDAGEIVIEGKVTQIRELEGGEG
jgi:hypothetical protein